jgi:hypothetical protein
MGPGVPTIDAMGVQAIDEVIDRQRPRRRLT